MLRRMANAMLDKSDDETRMLGLRLLVRAAGLGDAEASDKCLQLNPDPEVVLEVFRNSLKPGQFEQSPAYFIHAMAKARIEAGDQTGGERLMRRALELGFEDAT